LVRSRPAVCLRDDQFKTGRRSSSAASSGKRSPFPRNSAIQSPGFSLPRIHIAKSLQKRSRLAVGGWHRRQHANSERLSCCFPLSAATGGRSLGYETIAPLCRAVAGKLSVIITTRRPHLLLQHLRNTALPLLITSACTSTSSTMPSDRQPGAHTLLQLLDL